MKHLPLISTALNVIFFAYLVAAAITGGIGGASILLLTGLLYLSIGALVVDARATFAPRKDRYL